MKEELTKQGFVDTLMSQMREQKPHLYKQAQPTELQITCFLKSNAKLVKEALLVKAASALQTPPQKQQVVISCEDPEMEESILDEKETKDTSGVVPKPVLKQPRTTRSQSVQMKIGDSFKRKAPVSLEDLQNAVQSAEVITVVPQPEASPTKAMSKVPQNPATIVQD